MDLPIIGQVITKIDKHENRLVFHMENGDEYRMHHVQDCCENVYLEDVCGNLNDLVGSPVLVAYESGADYPPLSIYDESYTWTFYRFSTIKGSVTLRWYGTSNGYYSESVGFFNKDDWGFNLF
jgi:hypothetical protein